MSDYDDGGMSGSLVQQQIQQLTAQETLGQPAGTLPWWDLPVLIVLIAALIYAGIWLSRGKRRERQ